MCIFLSFWCKLVYSSGGGLWFRQSLDATVSDVYCVLGIIFTKGNYIYKGELYLQRGIIFTKGNFDEFVNYQSTVIFF